MGVAHNRWPPAPYVVDIFIAIDIPKFTSDSSLNKYRLTIDGLKGPNRRIDSARYHFNGLAEH